MFSLAACGGGKTEPTSADAKAGGPTAQGKAVDTPSADASRQLMARGAELNRAELQRASKQAAGGADAGKAMVQAAASSLVTAYRFYNTETGAHFYTINETEKQNVQNALPQFRYEGPAFYASGVASAGLNPVYRFFNEQTGVHFYTISEDEKALLLSDLPQFRYEGIAYYASKTEGSDLVPLFRFYLGSKGFHFYSNSATERDNIIATLPQYQFEGIGYYVLGAGWAPPVPLPAGVLPHSGSTDQHCRQAGSHALVACSSAAALALNGQQDGHRTAVHPMSYSEVPKSGGGSYARTECVKDEVTGLVWEGKEASGQRSALNGYTNYDDPSLPQKYDPDSGSYVNPSLADIESTSNSVGYVNLVNSMALCGYTDWRLPTRKELSGLVDHAVPFAGPTIRTSWFPNTQSNWYLSQSPNVGETNTAWNVSFFSGSVGNYGDGRDRVYPLRLVRGDALPRAKSCPSVPTARRYAFLAGGSEVLDRSTSLVWSRCSAGQTWNGSTCAGTVTDFTQEGALQYAAGQSGWRLPNVKELASLIDEGCLFPAIDSAAFPGTPTVGRHWSSTPNPFGPQEEGWTVFTCTGYVGSSPDSWGFRVRLVKDSQ